MPKRYHLNRPDLAQAVAVELRTCQDVKNQQRLLAARLAASGQLTAAQIAEQLELHHPAGGSGPRKSSTGCVVSIKSSWG
jgi:AraC-like DNA-binding protein